MSKLPVMQGNVFHSNRPAVFFVTNRAIKTSEIFLTWCPHVPQRSFDFSLPLQSKTGIPGMKLAWIMTDVVSDQWPFAQ